MAPHVGAIFLKFLSTDISGWGRGTPILENRLGNHTAYWQIDSLHAVGQQCSRVSANLTCFDRHRCQRGAPVCRGFDVIEANQGDILSWHQPELVEPERGTEGDQVVVADERRWSRWRRDELLRDFGGGCETMPRGGNWHGLGGEVVARNGITEPLVAHLADRGRGRTAEKTDHSMTEFKQVFRGAPGSKRLLIPA